MIDIAKLREALRLAIEAATDCSVSISVHNVTADEIDEAAREPDAETSRDLRLTDDGNDQLDVVRLGQQSKQLTLYRFHPRREPGA